MKELICIVCPKGCRLSVDDENGYKVSGNGCKRGEEYGKMELINPVRVITSTVCVESTTHSRCPVKTSTAIPKALIGEAMKTLDGLKIKAPVKYGQVIVKDVCGTDADFIAVREISL